MKKLRLAAAIAASFVTGFARAEDFNPDNEVSYNISLVNDSRFRFISQTRFDPVEQGGADYTNNLTGLYAAIWLAGPTARTALTTMSGRAPRSACMSVH